MEQKSKHCILKIFGHFCLNIFVIKNSADKGDSLTVFRVHNDFEIKDI